VLERVKRQNWFLPDFLFSFGDKAVTGAHLKCPVYNKVVLEGTQYKGVVQDG
jgi:hypothetical protein